MDGSTEKSLQSSQRFPTEDLIDTCKSSFRRPASAKSNVVFPELGGPSRSVNLQNNTRFNPFQS